MNSPTFIINIINKLFIKINKATHIILTYFYFFFAIHKIFSPNDTKKTHYYPIEINLNKLDKTRYIIKINITKKGS